MKLFQTVSLPFLIVLCTAPPPANASDHDAVLKFLKENVIGRTVTQQSSAKIDDGKVEAEWSLSGTYGNVVVTEKSIMFDEIVIIDQMNYDLDDNGNRVLPGDSASRAVAARHQWTLRNSTGRMIGFQRILSNSKSEATGTATAERVELKDGSLVVHYSSVGYSDFFAGGGKTKPGASAGTRTYSVDDGKLRCAVSARTYDVDPETLERKITGTVEEYTTNER